MATPGATSATRPSRGRPPPRPRARRAGRRQYSPPPAGELPVRDGQRPAAGTGRSRRTTGRFRGALLAPVTRATSPSTQTSAPTAKCRGILARLLDDEGAVQPMRLADAAYADKADRRITRQSRAARGGRSALRPPAPASAATAPCTPPTDHLPPRSPSATCRRRSRSPSDSISSTRTASGSSTIFVARKRTRSAGADTVLTTRCSWL